MKRIVPTGCHVDGRAVTYQNGFILERRHDKPPAVIDSCDQAVNAQCQGAQMRESTVCFERQQCERESAVTTKFGRDFLRDSLPIILVPASYASRDLGLFRMSWRDLRGELRSTLYRKNKGES